MGRLPGGGHKGGSLATQAKRSGGMAKDVISLPQVSSREEASRQEQQQATLNANERLSL